MKDNKSKVRKVKRKKRKLGLPQITFMLLNTLLVIAILGMYGYRLFKYKDNYSRLVMNYDSNLLYDRLYASAEVDYQYCDVFEDGSVTYFEDPRFNYVWYSGRLYRVLDINSDHEVRLVSTAIETQLLNSACDSFEESQVYCWLNPVEGDEFSGFYYNSLYEPDKYLTDTYYCSNKVNDVTAIACGYKLQTSRVALLTLNDYLRFNGSNGFLNIGERFWLMTSNTDGEFWIVDEEGNVMKGDKVRQFAGVYPVITMKGDVEVVSGNGTATYPLVIGRKKSATLSETFTTQYVTYSNATWRIVGKTADGNVKLMLDGYILDDAGSPVAKTYSKDQNYNTANGVGSYLNKTYLAKLENYKELLVKNKWYYGVLSDADNFDYHSGMTSTISCYVGIPTLAEYCMQNYPNISITGICGDAEDLIYVIDEYNHLYGALISDKMYIRPLICMKGEVLLASGDGTAENPYVIDMALPEAVSNE